MAQEKKIIYSCNYPIVLNLSTKDLIPSKDTTTPPPNEEEEKEDATADNSIEYSIYLLKLNGQDDFIPTPEKDAPEKIDPILIYKGRVYGFLPSQEIIDVDISPICREYLETYYENQAFNPDKTTDLINSDNSNHLTTIGRFEIRDGAGILEIDKLIVMYNYNTDYISQYLPDGANIPQNILNNPILLEADPRQFLTLSAYNLEKANQYAYTHNGKTESYPLANISRVFQLYTVNLAKINPSPGDTITISCNGQGFTYTIVPPQPNRFVLYYINKSGGMDNLLFKGKQVNSFTSTHTSIDLYSDRSNRLNFQNKKIIQEITKKYQLNTSILNDEQAAKIDELIYSPKVWIHDLDKNCITSCTIDETNYTIKNFRNNKTVTYRINITESQDYLRK